MNDYNELYKLLSILDSQNALEYMILIGSWAEYLYKETGYLKNYDLELRTLDIDFLIINKNKPRNKINLSKILENEGYIIDKDILTNITRIETPEGLSVDFLLSKMGKGIEYSLETNLGINAETLRNLEILKNNSIKVLYNNITVKVPKPEAYIIQKMIVNEERKNKIVSDDKKIKNLYKYIDKIEFDNIYNTLTKKQQSKVNNYINTKIKDINKNKGRTR